MKRALWTAVAAASFMLTGYTHAGVITGPSANLGDLIRTHGTVTSGNWQVSNFTYSGTNDMPTADGVNVIVLTDPTGNAGVRFQGGFLDTPASPGASDALITFTVTAINRNAPISDAHLVTNLAAVGPDATGSVTETFRYNTPENPSSMTATLQNQNLAVNFLSNYQVLQVQKDILLYAGTTPNGFATASFVDQTFSDVPEPASLGLLGLGAAGLLLRRRRA